MRISQDLAQQIAYKLTENSRKNVSVLEGQYQNQVLAFYQEQTPDALVAIFQTYPDWLYTTNYIRLHGHGFNHESVKVKTPVICNNVGNAYLTMNSKVADKLMSLLRKWEKAEKDYRQLKTEIKQALLTLKTYNNIRKELPEAAPFLPPPLSNALVVDFRSLKSKLKKQIEIVKP